MLAFAGVMALCFLLPLGHGATAVYAGRSGEVPKGGALGPTLVRVSTGKLHVFDLGDPPLSALERGAQPKTTAAMLGHVALRFICNVSSPVRALPPHAGAGQLPGFCTYLLAAVLQHSFQSSYTSGQSWSDCDDAVVPWVRGVVFKPGQISVAVCGLLCTQHSCRVFSIPGGGGGSKPCLWLGEARLSLLAQISCNCQGALFSPIERVLPLRSSGGRISQPHGVAGQNSGPLRARRSGYLAVDYHKSCEPLTYLYVSVRLVRRECAVPGGVPGFLSTADP